MGQCTVFALANFRYVIIDQIRHVHVVFNERLRTYCFRRKIDHNFCLSHPTADNRRDIKHLLATCDCCNLVYLQDVWENGYSGWRIHYSGGAMIRPPVRPPPPWCDREFCVIFAIFLWASFRDWTVKSVSQVLTVCVFCPLKTGKMYPNFSFWRQKNYFFLWRGPAPLYSTPLPSTPTALRPFLTQILNTPLVTVVMKLPAQIDSVSRIMPLSLWPSCAIMKITRPNKLWRTGNTIWRMSIKCTGRGWLCPFLLLFFYYVADWIVAGWSTSKLRQIKILWKYCMYTYQSVISLSVLKQYIYIYIYI